MQRKNIKHKANSLKNRITQNKNSIYGLIVMIRRKCNGNKNINLSRTIICITAKRDLSESQFSEKSEQRSMTEYILALFFLFQKQKKVFSNFKQKNT